MCSREECTEREKLPWKSFSKGIIFATTMFKEVWEVVVGEALVCEREPENTSDQYAVACEKGTFALKAVAGLFAVFVMGRYTVASVSVECKYVGWRAL